VKLRTVTIAAIIVTGAAILSGCAPTGSASQGPDWTTRSAQRTWENGNVSGMTVVTAQKLPTTNKDAFKGLVGSQPAGVPSGCMALLQPAFAVQGHYPAYGTDVLRGPSWIKGDKGADGANGVIEAQGIVLKDGKTSDAVWSKVAAGSKDSKCLNPDLVNAVVSSGGTDFSSAKVTAARFSLNCGHTDCVGTKVTILYYGTTTHEWIVEGRSGNYFVYFQALTSTAQSSNLLTDAETRPVIEKQLGAIHQ
jgi:hypothetical protein